MRPIDVSGQYYRLHPPERFAGRVADEFEVDCDRSALLVVDVYGHGFRAGETVQDHGGSRPCSAGRSPPSTSSS
ncbi:MAG: hypothetical protein AB1505_33145 [Candidatus Latescibacterota bacterium]